MNQALTTLADSIAARFGGQVLRVESRCGELTFEVTPAALRAVCGVLRDDPEYRFEQLIDLCGVDYSLYGQDEWNTDTATFRGFSRGVQRDHTPSLTRPAADLSQQAGRGEETRFAVVYHLLSVTHNR